MRIAVDAAAGMLEFAGERVPCAIGRGGLLPAAAKREGDGATPAGEWPVLAALIRRDAGFAPPARLPWRWIRPSDGWCDAPEHPCYNRPVSYPFEASAERLWRDDHLYDVVIILGHNQRPPVPGAGSAIFWHLAHPDHRPTDGCIAIAPGAMHCILPRLARGDWMAIS